MSTVIRKGVARLFVVALVVGGVACQQQGSSSGTPSGVSPDGGADARYSFRVNLKDPGSPGTFMQPTALDIPTSRNGQPGILRSMGPPSDAPIIEIRMVAGMPTPSHHTGGQDPGAHCHWWLDIGGGNWYEIHCGD